MLGSLSGGRANPTSLTASVDPGLTTDLFVGVEPSYQTSMRAKVSAAFNEALNPYHAVCRWNEQQQQRLQQFIDTVEALEP